MQRPGLHRWQTGILLTLLLALVSVATAAPAPPVSRYIENASDIDHPGRVDIALVLAVDVSSSIETSERLFQREAYAEALRDPRVAQMALGGGSGRVAIAYMEWSGTRYQRVHLPIRVMTTQAELAQFADEILAIEDNPGDAMYLQPTAVGDALLAAEVAMSELTVPARDYIIDISGDGVLNDGHAILSARDHVVALGLTVNGLPIEVHANSTEAYGELNERVSRFYGDCVIGGPGSFHLVARGFGDVRETLIMKLMLEMATLPPEEKRRIANARNTGAPAADSVIIPATILRLAPPETDNRQPVDCGEVGHPVRNPFGAAN